MYEELSLVDALQVVAQYERSIYRFIERHPDIPHVVLAYEDVLADPEAAVRSLSSFLAIDTTDRIRRKVIKFASSRRPAANNKRTKRRLLRFVRRPFDAMRGQSQ
jgi:hypothetical protein